MAPIARRSENLRLLLADYISAVKSFLSLYWISAYKNSQSGTSQAEINTAEFGNPFSYSASIRGKQANDDRWFSDGKTQKPVVNAD